MRSEPLMHRGSRHADGGSHTRDATKYPAGLFNRTHAAYCSSAKAPAQATLTKHCFTVEGMSTADGARLARLLGARNRAAFARDHDIKGGGSMISQHISGNRPISLEAAIAYARGFGVKLDDVSPEAAALVRETFDVLDNPEGQRAPSPAPPPLTLEAALPLVLDALRALPRERRAALGADWTALLAAPDSAELRAAVGAALAVPATPRPEPAPSAEAETMRQRIGGFPAPPAPALTPAPPEPTTASGAADHARAPSKWAPVMERRARKAQEKAAKKLGGSK